jgi:membrane protein YdbS with pleckstrin-like domain
MGFSLFPAIFDSPERVRFSSQEPDEHIELMLRQHWVTNIGWVLTSLIGFITPFFVSAFDRFMNFNLLTQIKPDVIIAIIILWYMFVMAYIIESFFYWYFNIYIVTNLHLVDISLQSLLSKSVTEILLEDVQSAETKMTGIFSSLFNYGDVIIETAAKDQKIQFKLVPQPDLVVDRIQDLQEVIAHDHLGGHDVS